MRKITLILLLVSALAVVGCKKKSEATSESSSSTTVDASADLATTKALSAFQFLATKNSNFTADVTGTSSGTAITATIPFKADLTKLVATFTTDGASVKVGTVSQVSGTTENTFASPVVYTVTAEDSSTQDYTVTVSKTAGKTDKAMSSFKFLSASNSGIGGDYTGTISGATITIAGSDTNSKRYIARGQLANLKATFTTTGESVKVGSTAQSSGTTANDFSSGQTYRITAEDGSTQDYQVTLSSRVPIPDTEQTTSFTATFGEDHDYVQNAQSYTDNGNGTLTDNVTGLVWQKAPDATTRTWTDSKTYCENNTAALPGSGWRLPSYRELSGLLKMNTSSPLINTTVFSGVQNNNYWSSTTVATNSTNSWYLNLSSGLMADLSQGGLQYALCVRGTAEPSLNMVSNGDGTVTDLVTGLVWEARDESAAGLVTWEGAIAFCEGLDYAGQTDWRLPNTKELSTLVDLTKSTTVKFDQTLFPTMKNSFYWASTTSNSSSTWAYDFSMSSAGSYTTYTKTNVADYVKCVRAGD